MSLRVEIVAHAAGARETAVELVGPLMIGTHEAALDVALGGVADLVAAMPARVVMRANPAFRIPRHDDREVAELHGEVVARIGDLAVVAGEDPFAIEYFLEIDTKHVVAAI